MVGLRNKEVMKIERALISVSDKQGLDTFAEGLHELGVEILSTGGTAKFIADLGIPVIEVSDFTGFPEDDASFSPGPPAGCKTLMAHWRLVRNDENWA